MNNRALGLSAQGARCTRPSGASGGCRHVPLHLEWLPESVGGTPGHGEEVPWGLRSCVQNIRPGSQLLGEKGTLPTLTSFKRSPNIKELLQMSSKTPLTTWSLL